MAYGTKYTIKFSDAKRQAWKIELQWKDYSGSATDLQPALNPLTISFGNDNDDKNESLIGSLADITIVLTDSEFDRTQFFTDDESEIKISITVNSTPYWSGFIKANFCRYPYKSVPYEFTISATDGIGVLKGKYVDFTDEARGSNQIGIIDILTSRGLYKAQYDELQTLNVLTSLHRIGKRAFENEAARVELFYDEDHNFITIFDALTYVATSYGGRIFAANGKYWFQRVIDLPQNDTPEILIFAAPTDNPTTDTIDSFVKTLGNGDLNNDVLYCNNDAYITIQAPTKQIKAAIDYKFIGALKNGDWVNYTGSMFDNWTAKDTNAVVHQIVNTDDNTLKACYIENSSGGSTYIYQQAPILWGYGQINLKTKVRFWGMSTINLSFRLLYNNGSGDISFIYDSNTEQWVAYAGSGSGNYTIKQTGSEKTKDINFDLPLLNEPTFGIDTSTPTAYIFEIRILSPTDDNSDASRPSGITTAGVELSPLAVSVKYQDKIGELDIADSGLNCTTIKDLDNFKLIDSKTLEWKTANYINYPGETSKLNWACADIPYVSDAIEGLQLISTLDTQNYPYEQLEGSFFSGNLSFYNIIKRESDSKLFMISKDEYDVKSSIHKLKLFELKKVTSTGANATLTKQYKQGEAFNA